MKPQTIQIFLPGGDPQGIRISEITTRIVQVIEVPRSLLQEFAQLNESKQVALYFLFGEADDSEETVYIGQSGNCIDRLISHNKKKDFWERALVVISRTNSLTQTHALFLEWYCIQAVREAGRYSDENGNSGSKPHTPPPLEADCHEIFDTAKTLLATLGYPLFDSIRKTQNTTNNDEIFYCKASDSDGCGLYTSEGFVVMKGSSGRIETAPSFENSTMCKSRQKIIDSEIMKEQDGRMVFQKDHLFSSPSAAAVALVNGHANGWISWKDKDGRTLDEIKRQTVDQ